MLEEEYEGQPLERLFAVVRAARRSPPPRSARSTAPRCTTAATSRSRSSTRGSPRRSSPTWRTPGSSSASRRRSRPGLDAKAVAGEIRERVLEELDYEFEAQNQRAFARAYDGHPFIYVPKVHSRLSRRRVLVSEYVDGHGFEHVKHAAPGRARHLRRDRLPLLLRLDLPPAALQRRHPPGQLPADGRRPGRLPRLRDDEAAGARARSMLEQRAVDAASRDDADALLEALDDLGFLHNPKRIDAERLMEHVQVRRRLVPRGPRAGDHPEAGDEDDRGDLRPALGLLRHGPQGGAARRRADGPADGDGPARRASPSSGRQRNWHRIMREWVYADQPSTVLGEAEWRYFERRGTSQTPGLATGSQLSSPRLGRGLAPPRRAPPSRRPRPARAAARRRRPTVSACSNRRGSLLTMPSHAHHGQLEQAGPRRRRSRRSARTPASRAASTALRGDHVVVGPDRASARARRRARRSPSGTGAASAARPPIRAGRSQRVRGPVAPGLREGPAEAQVGLELAQLDEARDLHRRDHRPVDQAVAGQRAGQLGLAAGKLQVAVDLDLVERRRSGRRRAPRSGRGRGARARPRSRGRRRAGPRGRGARRTRSCPRRLRRRPRSSRACCPGRSRRRPCARYAGALPQASAFPLPWARRLPSRLRRDRASAPHSARSAPPRCIVARRLRRVRAGAGARGRPGLRRRPERRRLRGGLRPLLGRLQGRSSAITAEACPAFVEEQIERRGDLVRAGRRQRQRRHARPPTSTPTSEDGAGPSRLTVTLAREDGEWVITGLQ